MTPPAGSGTVVAFYYHWMLMRADMPDIVTFFTAMVVFVMCFIILAGQFSGPPFKK
jgi:hypothetical protein